MKDKIVMPDINNVLNDLDFGDLTIFDYCEFFRTAEWCGDTCSDSCALYNFKNYEEWQEQQNEKEGV